MERTPLKSGYMLLITDDNMNTYNIVVKDVIGYGGSCIVYSGEKVSVISSNTISQSIIIKEFYPNSSQISIERTTEGHLIVANAEEHKKFEMRKKDFASGQVSHMKFYELLSNATLPRPFIYGEANNTSYAISDATVGATLSNIDRSDLSLNRIADIMISLCSEIGRIHFPHRYLYLDCKPDNFFHIYQDGKDYIYLFDFDTVISSEMIKTRQYEFCSYSYGWAAPEQLPNEHNRYYSEKSIGVKTDLFSLGMIFFWLLTGRKGNYSINDYLELEALRSRKFEWQEESAILKDYILCDAETKNTVNSIISGLVAFDVADRTYSDTEALINDFTRLKNQTSRITISRKEYDKLSVSEKEKNKIELGSTSVYLVDYSTLKLFGYSDLEIAEALVKNDLALYEGIPQENEGSPEQWAEYLSSFPDTFRYLVNDKHQIVGNWSFCAITDEQTAELTDGSLMEESFSVDTTDFIMLAGDYNGYLLNFSINPTYNNTKNFNILLESFEKQLEQFAEDGVFFKKWYVNVFRKDHSAMYKRIGFKLLCENKSYGFIYQLIPLKDNTIFSAKKGKLHQLYSEHFEKKQSQPDKRNSIDAIRAYSQVWTDIDKLFLRQDLMKFKPFFYEKNNQLPNEEDIDVGIALSLRIRDGIQYSQALLPFIPLSYRDSHFEFQKMIMASEITKLSLNCYKFEWEKTEHQILDENNVSVNSIIAYSKYWTDMGEVFLDKNNAKLRKYFFEEKDTLPTNKEEFAAAKIIAEMYRDTMMYSELLLDSIPFEFKRSYNVFKRNIMSAKIVNASMEDYTFKSESEQGY